MAQSKKYDCRVSKDGETWTAEILRRVSSKRTTVSKSQKAFASEAEAQQWADTELAGFLKNLAERNKRDSAKRR